MTSYRRYRAVYPFDARDTSEVTIEPGHTLIVGKTSEGVWPSEEKWMHGRNEETDKEGDFPGNFVEFVEEFVEPEPEVNYNESVLPLPPRLPEKPPTPASRGGVQVFPPSTSISPPPRPPHSTSPTHRPMGHSFSQGVVRSHPQYNDEEAPPPPPRRQAPAQQVPQQVHQENHVPFQKATTPPPSQSGQPTPRPRARAKRLSEPSKASNSMANQVEASNDEHNWMAVTYQIPVECMACKLMVSLWLHVDQICMLMSCVCHVCVCV